MSEWRIYPPPGSDHEKLEKYSKRQPLQYSYQVGDSVLMMVPSQQKQPPWKDQDTELEASVHTGNKQRCVRSGRIVQITTENGGDGDSIQRGTVRVDQHQLVVLVSATPTAPDHDQHEDDENPGSANSLLENSVFSFNPKEQQRFLQPNLATTTFTSGKMVVILVQETAPFRQLVQYQLHHDFLLSKTRTTIARDRVLEIGCSTGELSKRIWNTGVQAWVGMDTSLEMVERCSLQLKRWKQSKKMANGNEADYQVVRVDPLLEPHRAFKETVRSLGGPPTVVCVDIGGNRDFFPVMEILSWVFRSFDNSGGEKPSVESTSTSSSNSSLCLRLVIVKSRSLVRTILSDWRFDSSSDKHRTERGTRIRMEAHTGVISDGKSWFDTTLTKQVEERSANGILQTASLRTSQRIKHPAKAPMVLSPKDGTTPICRYHNYHPNGCKRRTYLASPCQLDHDHCHACRKPGHTALKCTEDYSCY